MQNSLRLYDGVTNIYETIILTLDQERTKLRVLMRVSCLVVSELIPPNNERTIRYVAERQVASIALPKP